MISLRRVITGLVFTGLFCMIGLAAFTRQADAQLPTTCPDLVREALARIETACSGTGRNQACYGNNLIDIDVKPNIAPFAFEQPGDVADVLNLTSIRLAGMDVTVPQWGVALMRLQANIPDALPGQNVTAILFGDTVVTESVESDPLGVGGIPRGFLLRTGFGDAQCSEMPDSGLVLQTPGGVDRVALQINNVDISLGSTAFIQTSSSQNQPNLLVQMLEGDARVEANGVAQFVQAGQFTSVPLGANGNANGQPSDPLPYDANNQPLPVDQLDRQITIPDPLIPSASAPVITDVVVTRRSDTLTQEEIYFNDREGDARFIQLSVVDSDPEVVEAIFQGTEIFASAGSQQAGTSVLRQTDCSTSPSPIDVLIRVTISDAGGNTSNVVEYRVACG